MRSDFLIEAISYTLPAIAAGVVAYLFFSTYIQSQDKKEANSNQKALLKEKLKLRLQAYERFTFFLERNDLKNLLVRTPPGSTDKLAYEMLLVKTIEQEFEYNLSQQIYISNELWAMIRNYKNNLMQDIRVLTADTKIQDSNQLRESLLKSSFSDKNSSALVMLNLKEETKALLKLN